MAAHTEELNNYVNEPHIPEKTLVSIDMNISMSPKYSEFESPVNEKSARSYRTFGYADEMFQRISLDPKSKTNRVLSTVSVVSLCYFNVSGGPIGSEQIVSAGGPLIGFIGLIIFPLLWSVPVALVTAELSTAFPKDGGYTVWVYHALGPFWGFQEGYLSWASGVVDNAIYPALAISVVTGGYGSFASPAVEYLIKVALVIILSLPSLLGVQCVGKTISYLAVISILPFVIFVFWGLPQMDCSVLGQIRHLDMTNHTNIYDGSGSIDINWSLLVNILFWNFNGFDGTSVFAGEVENPSRTYPKALAISVILIVAAYTFTLLVATGVNDPKWSSWKEGALSDVAYSIGGDFLVALVVVASLCSNIGMFVTELFVDSFQLYGMARYGLAPSMFARRHPKYNTPANAIFASVLVMLGLVAFDFNAILIINNTVCSLSITLIMIAAVILRIRMPNLKRPYKVPGGTVAMIVWVFIPTCLSVFIAVTTVESLLILGSVIMVVAFGVVAYFLQKRYGNLSEVSFVNYEAGNVVSSPSTSYSSNSA